MDDAAMERLLRPLGQGDAAGMLHVLRAMDAAESGNAFSTADDVSRILENDRTELSRDSRVYTDAAGVVGFVTVEVLAEREYVRATLGMRPDTASEAAPVLLHWLEKRAQEVALTFGWATAVAVTWQLPGALAEPALRQRRWHNIRRFNHLVADLASTAAVPPTPPGATVTTAATEEQAQQVHQVLEAALAGHWDHRAKTTERFLADEQTTAGYDRSLWYLASVNGQPAAAIIARQPSDQGWIGWLGTHPDLRGRGLARLLLTTAMSELAHRGCTQVALDADTGNDTGALRLYESAGFSVEYQANQWRHTTPTAAR